jgi:hypothetical protein
MLEKPLTTEFLYHLPFTISPDSILRLQMNLTDGVRQQHPVDFPVPWRSG